LAAAAIGQNPPLRTRLQIRFAATSVTDERLRALAAGLSDARLH
jgi:hypothetical protein